MLPTSKGPPPRSLEAAAAAYEWSPDTPLSAFWTWKAAADATLDSREYMGPAGAEATARFYADMASSAKVAVALYDIEHGPGTQVRIRDLVRDLRRAEENALYCTLVGVRREAHARRSTARGLRILLAVIGVTPAAAKRARPLDQERLRRLRRLAECDAAEAREARRYSMGEDYATEREGWATEKFRTVAAGGRRLGSTVALIATRTRTRARGAGHPGHRTTRSCQASGDSGDDPPGESRSLRLRTRAVAEARTDARGLHPRGPAPNAADRPGGGS